MTLLYKLWEELQEECYHQQPYVHAVDIGIGSHNDLIVSERIESVFYVEGSLQQVEFFILVDYLFLLAVAVERLSHEREHRLRVYVAESPSVMNMDVSSLCSFFASQ